MATISFPWNKIDRSELQIGDHIYGFRNMYIYSHHGIYVGENKVIHFSRTEEESERIPSGRFSSSGSRRERRCESCGYDSSIKRGVIKTCLDCFLKGHDNIFLFKYGVSSARFYLETPGTCTTGTCDEPKVVVERAEEMLQTNKFGGYDLLENNCECFAVYCKTGKRLSVQATYAKRLMSATDDGVERVKKRPFSPVSAVKTYLKIAFVPKFETLKQDKTVHRGS